jgi:polyphosphate kinase
MTSPLLRADVADSTPSLNDPSLYIDRELSLLAFQRRVLEEAQNSSNPLLERVKFLSILASNLDEFFMVRVAVLKQKAATSDLDGSVQAQIDQIRADVKQLTKDAYACWREVAAALETAGIELRDYSQLTAKQRESVESYFRQVVFPVLTPLAFDPGRPFPHISSLSLNLAVAVRDDKGVERFARVKVPDTLPQMVPVDQPTGSPPAGSRPVLVWLEQVIIANLPMLFPGLEIMEAYPFRVTRDAEVEIQELESDDLLETIEEAVWQRRFRAVVRLQISWRRWSPIWNSTGAMCIRWMGRSI